MPTPTPTTTIIDIAAAAVELLDDTGDFDASLWSKNPRFVRVYVETADRKSKNCGYFSISDKGEVDYSSLSRQKGTIRATVEDAIDAALPSLPAPAPRQARGKRCDECGHVNGHRMDCALMAD